MTTPGVPLERSGTPRDPSDSVVRSLDDYRPFDVGTPSRCYRCGTSEGVGKCVGEAGFVWSCDYCPHPEDV